tara:strand:- start:68 stop:220 length:153 start_codon:yes stop_codon:yes gene_type:complete
VTGTAVITMKACRALIEVLSPRLVPMRSSTRVRLPIIRAQNSRSNVGGVR